MKLILKGRYVVIVMLDVVLYMNVGVVFFVDIFEC